MNMLVLSQKLISADVSGMSMRLRSILKYFRNSGNFVTLISFYENDTELENIERCREFCDKVITVKLNRKTAYIRMIRAFFTGKPFKLEFLNSKKMHKTVCRELKNRNYDILYAFFYKMVPFIDKYDNYRRIADLNDALALNYDCLIKHTDKWYKKLFFKSERNRIYKYEKYCIEKMDKSIYVSEIDRNFMTDKSKLNKTAVVSCCVDTEYFYPRNSAYNKHEINYIGLMSYAANHDAVVNFIKNIYPLIKKRVSDVSFKIIGAEPKPELIEMSKHDSSIKVTGFVEDIRKEAETSCVSIAPVRIASGIQTKILEAMAMGIPVITSSIGAEGISDNQDILIYTDDEQAFADKVCSLLLDEKLRNKYSTAVRRFCADNFSQSCILKKLSGLLQE